MKRLICFMLCALLLTSSLSAFAEAEIPEAPNFNEELFRADFNEGQSVSDYGFITGGSRVLSTEQSDEEHGKSLRVKGNGEFNLYNHLAEATDDPVVLRFSYHNNNQGGGVILRFGSDGLAEDITKVSQGHRNARFSFRTANGTAFLYQNERLYLVPTDENLHFPEKQDDWNDVTIYFDYPHGQISYFINDTFMQTRSVSTDAPNFYVFDIGMFGADMWIDDILVHKIDKLDELEGITEARCTPELWYSTNARVGVTTASGHAGNIYTSSDPKVMDITYTDRLGSGGDYKVTYVMQDEYGKTIWSGEDKISLTPYGSATKKIRPENIKYDCYWLYITLSNDEGYTYETFTQLSQVNNPPRGYVNNKFGVNLHVGQGRPFDWRHQDLLLNAGIGVIRDGWTFTTLGPTVDTFEVDPRLEEYAKWMAENNILYIDNNPIKTTWNGNFATTPDVYIEEYSEVAKKSAQFFKSVGLNYSIEAPNEWNHSGGYTPENYALLMREIYKKVKAVDPNAIICGGATAGVPGGSMERAFAVLEGETAFDVNSHHTYDYGVGGPEIGEFVNSYKLIREIMDRHGYEDVEVWNTEVGWSVSPGHANQTYQNQYMARLIASQDAYGMYDVITQYDLICDGFDAVSREANFGMVEGYSPSWDHPEPYAARGSYLSLANFNALMHDAAFTEIVEVSKDSYCYRYKQADGSDMLFLVAKGEDHTVGLNLGCDTVTVYDMYGNAAEVSAVDGVFSFFADKRPIYIEGNFTNFEACDPKFDLLTTKIDVAPGSNANIQITKKVDGAAEVVAENGGDVYVASVDPFTGENAKIYLNTDAHADGNVDGLDAVNFKVMMGGKVVYMGVTDMEYVPSLSVQSFAMEPSSDLLNFWDGVLRLKSNQSDLTLNGKLNITSPAWISDIVGTVDVDKILPAATKVVPLNLTGDMIGTTVSMKLELDNGEVVDLATRLSSDVAHYAYRKPTIDGQAAEGEWNLTNKTRVRGDNPDVYLDVAMLWDEENFYLYCLTKDLYFMQQQQMVSDMWMQDSIQVALSSKQDSTQFTEYGFALMETQGVSNWCWSLETGLAGQFNVAVEDIELGIQRINNEQTLYEVRIPWSIAITDPSIIVPGNTFKYDILFNNDDLAGRTLLEYGAGIGSAKDITKHSPVLLKKEPW